MVKRQLINKIFIVALIVIAVISILITAACTLMFAEHYNLPFNELGRFFDEDNNVVYLEQSIEVYGILSVFFSIWTIALLVLIFKAYKNINR